MKRHIRQSCNLGNLTLVAKADNSKMSNLQWTYKNEVLKVISHLKMNMELIPIKKGTLADIDCRTNELGERLVKHIHKIQFKRL